MGKLIRQKQEAGELARQGGDRGRYFNIPNENIETQTLPDIGVTWKESSTSKNLAAVPEMVHFNPLTSKVIQSIPPS
jgi:hypothetical protein